MREASWTFIEIISFDNSEETVESTRIQEWQISYQDIEGDKAT